MQKRKSDTTFNYGKATSAFHFLAEAWDAERLTCFSLRLARRHGLRGHVRIGPCRGCLVTTEPRVFGGTPTPASTELAESPTTKGVFTLSHMVMSLCRRNRGPETGERLAGDFARKHLSQTQCWGCNRSGSPNSGLDVADAAEQLNEIAS